MFQDPGPSNEQPTVVGLVTSDPFNGCGTAPNREESGSEQAKGLLLSIPACRIPENTDCCGERAEDGTTSPVSLIDVGIGGCTESDVGGGEERDAAAHPRSSVEEGGGTVGPLATRRFDESSSVGFYAEAMQPAGSGSSSSDDGEGQREAIRMDSLPAGEAEIALAELSEGNELFWETEDILAAPNWLDVTHAMLDQADPGSGER